MSEIASSQQRPASSSSTASPVLTHRDGSRMGSPIVPLAPLEYLQNQRRGSITDPSLHAAGSPNASKMNHGRGLPPHYSPGEWEGDTDRLKIEGPASPYVFGDATVGSKGLSESNSQLRKLLRSPMGGERNGSTGVSGSAAADSHDDSGPSPSSSKTASVDYSARRPSLAGTKRKVSGSFPSPNEIDTQLSGPGVASMDVDSDAPPSKRRGSAIATQSIAQLSIHDRRHSVSDAARWYPSHADRRGGEPNSGPGPGPSADAGGPPPSLATFAWPKSENSSAMHDQQPHPTQPGDPHFATHHHMMPPLSMADRRMSMPESTTARILRSRSRPPSRSVGPADQQPTASSSARDEAAAAASPSASRSPKESGATPYSRSPELRVSHKLAERKRRREMKDLFDELRDQLPADRGMKASKWEILSKAIDFVTQLKHSHQEMAREIEVLRHELDVLRSNGAHGGAMAPFPAAGHVVYTHGPPPPVAPAPAYTVPSAHHPSSQPTSRPASSQNHHPFPTQPGAVMPMNGSVRAEGQQPS